MCGRYTLRAPASELREHFALDTVPELSARYNIAPAQPVLMVAPTPRRAIFAHWGLIPHWARDPSIGHRLINARAESLPQKPAFRDSFRHRRCLLPADGFYEWRRDGRRKVPLHIRRRDGGVFAFAGLWASWRRPNGENVISCAIITTDANDLVARIHDRMPAILAPARYGAWLDDGDVPALAGLLKPCDSDGWEAVEVSGCVNDARVDGPECLRPAASPGSPLFTIASR